MGGFLCCYAKGEESIIKRNNRVYEEVVYYVNSNYSYMNKYNRAHYIREIYWQRILELDNGKEDKVYYGNIIF